MSECNHSFKVFARDAARFNFSQTESEVKKRLQRAQLLFQTSENVESGSPDWPRSSPPCHPRKRSKRCGWIKDQRQYLNPSMLHQYFKSCIGKSLGDAWARLSVRWVADTYVNPWTRFGPVQPSLKTCRTLPLEHWRLLWKDSQCICITRHYFSCKYLTQQQLWKV